MTYTWERTEDALFKYKGYTVRRLDFEEWRVDGLLNWFHSREAALKHINELTLTKPE